MVKLPSPHHLLKSDGPQTTYFLPASLWAREVVRLSRELHPATTHTSYKWAIEQDQVLENLKLETIQSIGTW